MYTSLRPCKGPVILLMELHFTIKAVKLHVCLYFRTLIRNIFMTVFDVFITDNIDIFSDIYKDCRFHHGIVQSRF